MILDRLTERIRIDWSGFAVTHGGFFGWFEPDEYEPWPGGRPPEPEPAIVGSGGICAPMGWQAEAWSYTNSARWEPWRRWYCVHRVRIADLIPTLTAQRGGIRFLQPPPIGHPSREWITDDPYSHLGPDAPPPPSWPAQPAPMPAEASRNLLQQRSISGLIRLRRERRRS